MSRAVGDGAVRGPRWWPVVAASLWVLVAIGMAGFGWLDRLLRSAGRADLALQADEAPYLLVVATASTVGAVLIARRPRHPVGWLMLALALLVTANGVGDAYARYGLVAAPGALPAAAHVGMLTDTFWAWPACVSFILLLTPTGTLPTRRWRWWACLAAAAPVVGYLAAMGVERAQYPLYTIANPFYVPALAPLRFIGLPVLAVTMLSLVLGGASLVVRFRSADGVQRQQLRWVASAGALAVVAVPVAVTGVARDDPVLVGVGVIGYASVLCLAIGAAILRYRLYDLDRIVSRTLAYGLLSVLLTAAYGAAVLVVGWLLGDRGSDLAVAVATLVVARLLRPAYRQIQALVDRRFDRRRYDAARTIAGFRARLRDEADLAPVAAELLDVVCRTMQPTRASLWLSRRTGATRAVPAP